METYSTVNNDTEDTNVTVSLGVSIDRICIYQVLLLYVLSLLTFNEMWILLFGYLES